MNRAFFALLSAAAVLFPAEGPLYAGEPAAGDKEAKAGQRALELIEEACRTAGCEPKTLGYSRLPMKRDPFRLARFDAHMADALLFKSHCDEFVLKAKDSATDALRMFDLLADLNDARDFPDSPLPAPDGADPAARCMASFGEIWSAAGRVLEGEEEKSAKRVVDGLGADTADALASFLYSAALAARVMTKALKDAGHEAVSEQLAKGDSNWVDYKTGAVNSGMFDFCRRFDLGAALLSSRIVLAAALNLKERILLIASSSKARLPVFSFETPFGSVVFAGKKNDDHPSGRYLLIVDWGGDDSYGHGAGGADFGQFASVCIDLSGNDLYTSAAGAPPSFGAGLAGTGILMDLGGNDRYVSFGKAQGHADFGAGILFDASGDDVYVIGESGQGAATFGVAALIDCSGNDSYTCYYLSQGVGLVRGVGALVDAAGNDVYVARDDDIKRPSPQSREHNSSLSQGVGFGRRAVSQQDPGASGGVGLLLDLSGNDRYSGGVMAQAHGYWFATGILADFGGDDLYEAAWYGQSTSAHFALSYMRDFKGNDTYKTKISQSLGNGRDFSISIFQDDDGNDLYHVPDRSAGCGNINAIGIFLDLNGSDTYKITSANSMGIAILEVTEGQRLAIPTFGLFADGGGKDVYEFKSEKIKVKTMLDGGSWVRTSNGREFSAGIDR